MVFYYLVSLYTVSKVNVICGPIDHRIGVSKGWTYANIILSTIAFSGGIYWLSVNTDFTFWVIILMAGGPFTIGVILTIIFLHYDSLCCCCCDCCLGEEQVVIHDPSNPGVNLVWRDGQVTKITYIRSFIAITRVVNLDE